MALDTNQYGYLIDPLVPITDDTGRTIKDGFLRVYIAGSSTPVITYRNYDGAANEQTIELDNSGRCKYPVIVNKSLAYKVVVYDAQHSQETPIITVDKMFSIGASVTVGAGATVVTGIDGLTTKPDGFVDASVIGTDGYVALDHTLVEDELDTDAKVTAVEDDRYIPLLNEDVNDHDSKMTLGRLWKWVLGKINNLPTSITNFRTGDVIPVDGPDGTAKMGKDDLLRETAENVQTKIVPRNLRDGIINSNGVSPFENFATSSGRYEFTQDDFVLQSALNRLSSELLFCPKGDTIHIVPEDGLTVRLVQVLVNYSPWVYNTLAKITEETEYEFVQNAYYYILVTNGSTIALADYGNTKIDVRNSVLFKAKDFETTDSFLSAKVLLDVGETHKKIENVFATKDGRINLSKSDFAQNGTKLLSVGIDVKVGDHFIFDGSANSSKVAILRKNSGGSYSTIVGPSSSLDYVSDTDRTIYIDLRIEGSTYSLNNYAYGSCVLARKMSDKTIDVINARLDLLDAGGTIPYYGYVKNGRWCAGVPSESSTNRADYLALEMPDKVKKVGCKFYYADNATSKGTVALAVLPDGWSRKVHSITSKSLHLILTPNQVKVDFLGQFWGRYWYTNLLTRALSLDTSSNVEHELSMEISGEQVLVNVDGTIYTGTNTSDKSMDEVAGKYAFVEHFSSNTLNVGMPEFTAFRVESQTKVAFDAFKRENGVCWLTPQGMPYINLSQDAVYGDFNATSYPDW